MINLNLAKDTAENIVSGFWEINLFKFKQACLDFIACMKNITLESFMDPPMQFSSVFMVM